MSTIAGWMTELELEWLAEQGRAYRNIIEVGSWKGRSTVALASSGAFVTAVDTWLGTPHDPRTQAQWYPEALEGPDVIFNQFKRNVHGLNVSALRLKSHSAAFILHVNHGPVFDMVFIDADHAYEAVHTDIIEYRKLLRPGGLLSGHDYHKGCSGVIRAVDELLPGATIGPDSIWSIRP